MTFTKVKELMEAKMAIELAIISWERSVAARSSCVLTTLPSALLQLQLGTVPLDQEEVAQIGKAKG